MEVKIEITAEQIDQMVRKSLVEAAIGKSIIREVQECLKADSYNSPIKEGVKKAIQKIVDEVLCMPENQMIMREAVIKVTTKEVMTEISNNAVRRLQEVVREQQR